MACFPFFKKQSFAPTREVTSYDDRKLSEERMNHAVQVGRMGIWEYNLQTSETYWDDNMFNILGIDRLNSDEIIQLWLSCAPIEDIRGIATLFDQVAKTGKSFEYQYSLHINEKTFYLHLLGSGITEPNGTVVRIIGVNRDITPEVQSQKVLESERARLLSAAKMTSLGEMASNIAHEINNPLAIIMMRVQQLRTGLYAPLVDLETVETNLKNIEHTTMRISKIIKSLRSFSRDASRDPFEKISLIKIMDETWEICGPRFKSFSIEVEVKIPENLELECRPSELAQVFVNLLSNSFYAVASQPEKKVMIKAEDLNEEIQLTFVDSGPPIPIHVRRKIMQPFFTTKPIGFGTGLGLMISQTIVENHRGKIKLLENEPQTTFIIRLPKLQSTNEVSSAIP